MKGTPEMPQCGFSRASIELLGVQGVDPAKFSAFNVLEDEELRQGIHWFLSFWLLAVDSRGNADEAVLVKAF
jgi:glutaredoxin-related protein